MIDSALAIDIAQKRASEKGWGFAEPIAVAAHRGGWFGFGGVVRFEVEGNAGTPDIKTRFVIDAKSGEILVEAQQLAVALAIEIARKRAKEKRWGLSEPVAVIDHYDRFGGIASFEVVSNPVMRGTKARFLIDATNGEIISEGYIPR